LGRDRLACLWLVLGLLGAPAAAEAPARPDGPPPGSAQLEAVGADTDPTKPVLLSIRDEYTDLPGDPWVNAALFRMDAVVFGGRPGGPRGAILRADVPLVTAHDGFTTKVGLGDIYGQVLLFPGFVPSFSGRFLLGLGTGLVLPTATDERLGREKWIAAPAIAPVLRFPKRGYAYVKVQDWISFAGDDERLDVHYLTVTPTVLWRIGRRWWTLVDAESTTNWKLDDQTSFRAGVSLGRMLSSRRGVSLKAELPFGGNRQTDWALKAVFFLTRF